MQGTPKKRNWAVIAALGIGVALAVLSVAETLRHAAATSTVSLR